MPASLPLFSPPSSSFVPSGGVSLARPPASVARAPVGDTGRPRTVTQLPLWPAVPSQPVLRSMFDAIPAPAATRPRRPMSDHRPDATALSPSRAPSPGSFPSGDGAAIRAEAPTAAIHAPTASAANALISIRRDPQPALRTAAPAPDATAPATPVPAAPSERVRSVERTEDALREAGLAGRCWRGDALSVSPLPSTPSGFRALDEELPGGGWPQRCLTELLLTQTGIGEIRFLAATLSALTQADREIVLLAPPHLPDPTGWEQLGIDMRRVLVVRTARPADRLWAIEQSLKSSAFGALVAWLPEEKTLARNDVLRRLQSLASSANGLTFLMRPAIAEDRPSPAALRLTLAAGRPQGARRTVSVRLVKRRGPVLARPLTLVLPEIHRGMKAFGRTVEDVPSAERSTTMPSSALRPVPTSIASHALAGALLPDAVA